MYHRIIELESKEEAANLKETLELNYIPCEVGQITTRETSEKPEKTIYFLTFPNEYNKEYSKYSSSYPPAKAYKVQEIKRGIIPLIKKYFLIPYAVLATVFCAKYFHLNLKTSNAEKNFVYSWTPDNTTLRLRSKETNKLHASYKDENFDNNWERVIGYSNGKKIYSGMDSDENGLIEQYLYYDIEGNVVSTFIDANQDGISDTITYVLESQEKLMLVDKDGNGIHELIE